MFDLDDALYGEKEYIRFGFKAVSDYFCGGYKKSFWEYFEAEKPIIEELLNELWRINVKSEALRIHRKHKLDIRLYIGVKIDIITDGRLEEKDKMDVLILDVGDIILTAELEGGI